MLPSLYYESHITIEPVFGERLDKLKELCGDYEFRVADLLMKKSAEGEAKPSTTDTFCSGRDADYSMLHARMTFLLFTLALNAFKIYRYKIEQVVLDSKMNDELDLL